VQEEKAILRFTSSMALSKPREELAIIDLSLSNVGDSSERISSFEKNVKKKLEIRKKKKEKNVEKLRNI